MRDGAASLEFPGQAPATYNYLVTAGLHGLIPESAAAASKPEPHSGSHPIS